MSRSILLLIAGLLVGILSMSLSAQQPAAPSPGRFQLSAWASNSHGVYVLDTQTGEVWHSLNGGKLESLGKVR